MFVVLMLVVLVAFDDAAADDDDVSLVFASPFSSSFTLLYLIMTSCADLYLVLALDFPLTSSS